MELSVRHMKFTSTRQCCPTIQLLLVKSLGFILISLVMATKGLLS